MKKAILIFGLILSTIFCKAQKDSVVVTDSLPLLSIGQMNAAFNDIKKVMTIDQMQLFQFIVGRFQAEIDKSIADLKKKKK